MSVHSEPQQSGWLAPYIGVDVAQYLVGLVFIVFESDVCILIGRCLGNLRLIHAARMAPGAHQDSKIASSECVSCSYIISMRGEAYGPRAHVYIRPRNVRRHASMLTQF